MGRRKVHPENKAKGTSISLAPIHHDMLDELTNKLGERKSDIVQRLIQAEYSKVLNKPVK